MTRRIFIIIIPVIVIIAIVSCVALSKKSPEIKARKAVDVHLESIMTGKGDPYATIDITKIQSIFINVLDFKYLNTVKNERVRDNPMVFDRDRYEVYKEFDKEKYNSYEEFLQFYKKFYGDSAKETKNGLIVESPYYHYEFAFLYDVTLTNRLGQKLYKKYVFEVRRSLLPDPEYIIVDFYER